MPTLSALNYLLFTFSALGLLAVFLLYPALIFLLSIIRISSTKTDDSATDEPSVTFLIVVRNGQDLIRQKIENCLAMDYPAELLQVVVYSDGSDDETVRIAQGLEDSRVQVYSADSHLGKITCLNAGMEHCTGEIVVLTDADGICPADALGYLLRPFVDKRVGGVCGQRVIKRDNSQIKKAQNFYIRLDSTIKLLESARGKLTSNDGKLYAIRRTLFQPLPPAVTDDLYMCMTVISQGERFVFAPLATVEIRVPSRNPRHEISRRRRIVTRSLNGIWNKRVLLNPFRFGLFSFGLFINKVMRRMMPFFLLGTFCSSALLASSNVFFLIVLFCQIFCYVTALQGALSFMYLVPMKKITTVPFYFCLGNWGTLLGVLDFLSGRRVDKWTPQKTDSTGGGTL